MVLTRRFQVPREDHWVESIASGTIDKKVDRSSETTSTKQDGSITLFRMLPTLPIRELRLWDLAEQIRQDVWLGNELGPRNLKRSLVSAR